MDISGLYTTAFGVRGLAEADDFNLALTGSPDANFIVRSFIMTLNISSFESVSKVTNLNVDRRRENTKIRGERGKTDAQRHSAELTTRTRDDELRSYQQL